MSFFKPLFYNPNSGKVETIAAPNEIDPSVLPTASSSSTQIPQTVASGSSFDIPAGSYQVAVGPIVALGAITCEGELLIL